MNSVSSIDNKRSVRITIDLNAIAYNLHQAKLSAPNQKQFAVIKADAYGHGAVRVAKALSEADAFAVATLNEAIELRDAGISKPILLLQGAQSRMACDEIIRRDLWPVIHCEEQLQWFKGLNNVARLQPWLKVDTGMGRLGFLPDRAQTILNDTAEFQWAGMLTHFSDADDFTKSETAIQIERFNALESPSELARCMANSAAILAWPQARSDWSRPGVMLYGCNPLLDPSRTAFKIKPAMRVSVPIFSVKQCLAGTRIGYAGTYLVPEDMPVAFAAVGYGDGFPRGINGDASVWVNGKSCSILGRVSMDSIAIDVRGLPNVKLGTEVVLWGAEQPVEVLATAANTIGYELFTSIKGKREYVELANKLACEGQLEEGSA